MFTAVEPSLGFNISADIFAGFLTKDICEIEAMDPPPTAVTASFIVGSFTVFVSPGEFIGMTFGVGPGVPVEPMLSIAPFEPTFTPAATSGSAGF